ncbi:MAG: hypothetical protein EG825_00385 [Rhodocyclaceae bacterium]|nr:hypothetical protein [Rhodocyclaceae bacterium]
MGIENLAQEAIEQNTESTAEGAVATEQTSTPTDPYEAELAATEAMLKQENGDSSTDTATKEAAVANVDGKEQQQAAPAAEEKKEQMVPVSALYKERKARQAAELRNAQLEGQNQVLASLKAKTEDGNPDVEPAKKEEPQDELSRLIAEQDALAERFDAGEITAVEWKRLDREVTNKIDDYRATARQDQAIRLDSTLEDYTNQLIEKYPVLNSLSETQIVSMTQLAYAQAEVDGKPIQPGIEGTKQLRQRIAEMANRLYGTPATQSPSAEGTPVLSDKAAARAAKVDMAAGMPPDVSQMGSAASGVQPSESEILSRMEKMTDEEALRYLDSLPVVKSQIMGRIGLGARPNG